MILHSVTSSQVVAARRDRPFSNPRAHFYPHRWNHHRKISECYIVLPQGEAHTPVILGQEDDEALLGVVTLKILGLVLDPFKRKLQPMRMLLV